MDQSVNGRTTIFQDEEILMVHQSTGRNVISSDKDGVQRKLQVYYTEYGKPIIQQQATRGCSAAMTAMLIVEHGKIPDIQKLSRRNLGDIELMISDIRAAKLYPRQLQLPNDDALLHLKEALGQNGPAILTIDDPLAAGHVIIVDEISADLQQVRLRDSYHGWQITVEAQAFGLRWSGGMILQVQDVGS